jgi:hypothetical protein
MKEWKNTSNGPVVYMQLSQSQVLKSAISNGMEDADSEMCRKQEKTGEGMTEALWGRTKGTVSLS